MQTIALFPLHSVILPEGNMSLRIFEPRYLRMVAECQKQGIGFGVCLLENAAQGAAASRRSSTGTLVQISQVDSQTSSVLNIDIVGIKRFQVQKTWVASDGLRMAQVTTLDNWQPREIEYQYSYISQQLKHVFQVIPQIGSRHDYCYYDDASWVCQRWIELLPLSCDHFDHIVSQPDCKQAIQFLQVAIEPLEPTQASSSR